MLWSRIRAGVDRLLVRFGYVPEGRLAAVRQMHADTVLAHAETVQALRTASAQVERELRHKSRDLEHQLAYRHLLERDVEFLRQLELARVTSNDGVRKATETMERCIGSLVLLMQDQWPDAVINDPREDRVQPAPT